MLIKYRASYWLHKFFLLFIYITSSRKISFEVKYYTCYRMGLSLHGPPSCSQQQTYGTEGPEISWPHWMQAWKSKLNWSTQSSLSWWDPFVLMRLWCQAVSSEPDLGKGFPSRTAPFSTFLFRELPPTEENCLVCPQAKMTSSSKVLLWRPPASVHDAFVGREDHGA